MGFLIFLGFILAVMFFIGLIGLISGKGNKKVFLTLLLVPIVIAVIGFGTCVVILNNL
ncbi:hypothetical protein [Flavobacterium sp. CF136]|uniref:hypothetical protein n=1 Tax=Flavobacterium sp. (strain CF136) TaxID=1144313 RepID=UPI0012FC18EA|nr:hypothetical protein [Flavobacterium sp. CF136]